MPVRLIMNNKTLTVLEGVTFDKTVHIFNLQDTSLAQVRDKGCFTLEEKLSPALSGSDKTFSMSFCPFGLVDKNKAGWVNEWDYDYNLFKYQCAVPRYNVSMELTPQEEEEVNNKLNQAKVDIIGKKEKNIVQQQDEDRIEELHNRLDNDELEVVAKTFDFEEMAMKEEEEKEKNAQDNLAYTLDKEREKRECLLKRIKQKEIENQYNLAKQFDQKTANEDMEDQQRLIKIKRNEIKSKLELLRARAKRREDLLKQRIKTVRYSMNNDISKAYRRSTGVCNFEDTKEKKYCNARFSTNPVEYGNCLEKSKDKDSYCIFCCEQEVGAMYIDQREECSNKCKGEVEEVKSGPQKWFYGMPLSGMASQI